MAIVMPALTSGIKSSIVGQLSLFDPTKSLNQEQGPRLPR